MTENNCLSYLRVLQVWAKKSIDKIPENNDFEETKTRREAGIKNCQTHLAEHALLMSIERNK